MASGLFRPFPLTFSYTEPSLVTTYCAHELTNDSS